MISSALWIRVPTSSFTGVILSNTPTARDKQTAAIQFLLKNGFHTPDYLLKQDIVTRIGMHGITQQISDRQKRLLQSVLNTATADRMMDLEATGFANYSMVELFNDLQSGIFSELNAAEPEIDIYRRNLQRAYVEQLITFITPKSATGNDLQAMSRGKLLELEQILKKQVKKKRNNTEHYHFVDLAESIRIALERDQG